jgi:hypothetical protein
MGRQKITSGPAFTKLSTFQKAQPSPPAAPAPPCKSNAPVLARFIICDRSFIENRRGGFPGAPLPQQAVSHKPSPLPGSIALPEGQVNMCGVP